jgi:uncharacterized protein YjiS (DUF1127 family)
LVQTQIKEAASMAHVQNITPSFPSALVAQVEKLQGAVQRHLAQRAVYRATLRELQALSNRELADLGIHRSEISRIAQDAMKTA